MVLKPGQDKLHFIFALLISLSILVSCGQDRFSGIDNSLESESNVDLFLVVGYKDTVYLDFNGSAVCFDSLLSDSRCPQGAECIWEGNARVRVLFWRGDTLHSFFLDTNSEFQQSVMIDGQEIALMDLRPYPVSGVTYTAGEYRLYLRISR